MRGCRRRRTEVREEFSAQFTARNNLSDEQKEQYKTCSHANPGDGSDKWLNRWGKYENKFMKKPN